MTLEIFLNLKNECMHLLTTVLGAFEFPHSL